MERREFLRALGGSALGLATAGGAFGEDSVSGYVARVPADTGAAGEVVVIGGGMAGATVAKYLRVWGGARVRVTLIERDAAYVSNIMSNLVLNGSRTR
jgi:NADPH-dependent 2,4-dienoyl-CoA reductase/sulfur reductase-like enzyme